MGCSSSIKVKSKNSPTDTHKGDTADPKEQEEPKVLTLLEVEGIHSEFHLDTEDKTGVSQEGREKLAQVPDLRDADGDGEGES